MENPSGAEPFSSSSSCDSESLFSFSVDVKVLLRTGKLVLGGLRSFDDPGATGVFKDG